MKYNILHLRPELAQEKRLSERYQNFNQLTSELELKEVPLNIITEINEAIDIQNKLEANKNAVLKAYRNMQSKIVKLLEKELQLVPLHHYRNKWMIIGMSVIGVPFGIVYSRILDNPAMMSIGIPMGMGIGVMIGSHKDKKAFESGKQLNIELKY